MHVCLAQSEIHRAKKKRERWKTEDKAGQGSIITVDGRRSEAFPQSKLTKTYNFCFWFSAFEIIPASASWSVTTCWRSLLQMESASSKIMSLLFHRFHPGQSPSPGLQNAIKIKYLYLKKNKLFPTRAQYLKHTLNWQRNGSDSLKEWAWNRIKPPKKLPILNNSH